MSYRDEVTRALHYLSVSEARPVSTLLDGIATSSRLYTPGVRGRQTHSEILSNWFHVKFVTGSTRKT